MYVVNVSRRSSSTIYLFSMMSKQLLNRSVTIGQFGAHTDNKVVSW
jgi:hypothetical protein